MMNDDTYSDFILVSNDGTEFKVHKNILAARSQHFKALFQSPDVSSQNGTRRKRPASVDLEGGGDIGRSRFEDIDKRQMEALCRYLYTDQLPSTPVNAVVMLPIADRFHLAALRDALLHYVRGQFSTENILQILTSASKSNSETLECVKKEALGYCAANWKEIMKSDQWRQLIDEHPELVQQIMARCVTKDPNAGAGPLVVDPPPGRGRAPKRESSVKK